MVADIACIHIAVDVHIDSRPVVVSKNLVCGECLCRVTTKYAVVMLIQDLGAEGFRNKDTPFAEDNVIFSCEVRIAMDH